MLIAAAFLVVAQTGSVTIGPRGVAVAMETREDTARADSTRRARRPAASAGDVATAFADPTARATLERARFARNSQDSSIRSYEAETVQRISNGLRISRLGRDRMILRAESAARVRWQRGVGASIEIIGKRAVAPIVGGTANVNIESMLSPVPYFPGRDALWFGVAVSSQRDLGELVHPLGADAETHYVYSTGDSVRFRLPDGNVINLRELLVRPRAPRWNRVVGSLWFDTGTGQLVRAAYKLSEPLDLFRSDSTGETPAFVKAALHPSTASIVGVAVEYGLHQGRYWLPRTQAAEGEVRTGFVRVPIRIEERFTYSSVNTDLAITLPPVPPRPSIDTNALAGLTGQDHERRYAELVRQRDSLRQQQDAQQCAQGGRMRRAVRHDGTLPVVVRISCDSLALANSPALPPSIFDDGDEVFGDAERDALLAKAMAMVPEDMRNLLGQRTPQLRWGFDLVRYNRVEGLSSALSIDQQILPLGIAMLRVRPRIGTADRVFNYDAELRYTRAAGSISLIGYKRLVAANDWGDPLSFGSAASAFLFGRDEGLYYRATGGELVAQTRAGTVRLFAEKQSDALARTKISLPGLVGATAFDPDTNIRADHATARGGSWRMVRSFGADPRGWRLDSDLRTEAAFGDFEYQRLALDLTTTHPITRTVSASVTLGGGTSGGPVPVQRRYYLGGSSTVRGQPAGAMSGDAYWLARAEVGRGAAARRVLFADFGWAGERSSWMYIRRPASGVGAGFSLLDGVVRFDVARGLYPARQWRVNLYMDAKF